MRYRLLLLAAFALLIPACQSTNLPKAKLAIETPPGDIKDVSCKLEVTLN